MKKDNKKHGYKIEPHEPGDPEARPDEAGQGDEDEEGGDGDYSAVHELVAVGAGVGGEPDGGGEDGEGEEEGYEV